MWCTLTSRQPLGDAPRDLPGDRRQRVPLTRPRSSSLARPLVGCPSLCIILILLSGSGRRLPHACAATASCRWSESAKLCLPSASFPLSLRLSATFSVLSTPAAQRPTRTARRTLHRSCARAPESPLHEGLRFSALSLGTARPAVAPPATAAHGAARSGLVGGVGRRVGGRADSYCSYLGDGSGGVARCDAEYRRGRRQSGQLQDICGVAGPALPRGAQGVREVSGRVRWPDLHVVRREGDAGRRCHADRLPGHILVRAASSWLHRRARRVHGRVRSQGRGTSGDQSARPADAEQVWTVFSNATILLESLDDIAVHPIPAPLYSALVRVLRQVWDVRLDRFSAPDARAARSHFVKLVIAICADNKVADRYVTLCWASLSDQSPLSRRAASTAASLLRRQPVADAR